MKSASGINDIPSDRLNPIPQTLGVCPVCWGEFSVPDAKTGDKCPMGPHHTAETVGEDGHDPDHPFYDPPLVIFVREAEVERLREGWDADVDWANKLLVERDEARAEVERLREQHLEDTRKLVTAGVEFERLRTAERVLNNLDADYNTDRSAGL